MPKRYNKKAQVLFTEEEFNLLQEIALERGKKLGTIIREACRLLYLEKHKEKRREEAIHRLLSLEETPIPVNYQEWEEEYLKDKCPCK
jgi:hypothetical protein